MNANDLNSTTELDLKRLESQLDRLIITIERLMSERAELIEKTELARSRVEAMISRLRTIETG
jgi:cell division protein ZapB